MILASLAFGIPLQFEKVYTEGIGALGQEDLAYAAELGYRIKHLGICRRTSAGIELRVHPTLIPGDRLIANGIREDFIRLVLPMSAVQTSYYLRVAAVDRPGVLWRVAQILSEAGISIEALIQKEAPEGSETATMILLTSVTIESRMSDAIAAIEALESTRGRVTRIRMEKLDG